MRLVTINIFLILFVFACTKDKGIPPCPTPLTEETHTIKFIFVNKNGFRNDSVGNGVIDTVLKAVCLHTKYYNVKTNTSTLHNTCYNRDFPINNYPLLDSILQDSYNNYIGSQYAYEVELVWKNPIFPYTTKLLKYGTPNWPNADTIKTFQDTVIKFVWPDDTMPSSRFHKTFQYP